MSKSLQITKDNFQSIVESGKPVLVDFWAPWCGPCKMVGPIVEELAEELADKVIVAKLNVDEEQELAVQFGVMSIPTLIVFKDGKEVKRSVGFKPKAGILELLGE